MGSKTILQNEELFMDILNGSFSSIRNAAADEFLSFWKYYDAIYYTVHSQIIEKLYVLGIRPLEEVAFVSCVDDKTLYRYRKKYMELFSVIRSELQTE